MIARVAEHEDIPAEADEQYVARFRDLLCRQPGFRGRYHLLDPATGRALSAMLWEDEAALQALRARDLGVAGGRRADQRRGPDDGARPRGGRGARAATR